MYRWVIYNTTYEGIISLLPVTSFLSPNPSNPWVHGGMIRCNKMRHCYAGHNLLNCALSYRMGGPQLFVSDASSPSNDVPIFIFTKIYSVVLPNASINFHKKKKINNRWKTQRPSTKHYLVKKNHSVQFCTRRRSIYDKLHRYPSAGERLDGVRVGSRRPFVIELVVRVGHFRTCETVFR